jgi:3-oxoacyl-[acyl-carrier-protein] synthase-3
VTTILTNADYEGRLDMPYFKFDDISITGIASAVPTQIVKVDSFITSFGEDVVKRFKTMTGIEEYRKTSVNQTASDLGYVAAERLLNEKNISRSEIGALIFVTHSHDYRRPATACVLHKRLGLSKECAAFDINLGCSAFVYGLQTVCSLMQSSNIEIALLVVAEALTKVVYPGDRSTAMLFGDAGSAILFEKIKNSGTIKGLLRTDGNGYKAIIAPAGGFRNMYAPTEPMIWPDGNARTLYNTNMNGAEVFNFTISDVPIAMKDFFDHTNTSVDDYDCFALHQANKFIHKQISKKLKIPMDKMPLCLDRFGNTSAPAIPLTICDRYGNSTSESIVTLMCGFGVGLSWGVISATINTDNIFSVFETEDYFAEGFINSPAQL